MHDSIELETRGVVTALICTDQFITTAKAMAQIRGIPDYPFAIVPHPMGSLTPQEVRAKAEAAVPKVIELLLGPR